MFTLLTAINSVMLSLYLSEFKSNDGIIRINEYILFFVCIIGFLIEIGAVFVLATSNNSYKERDILNKEYLKMQERQYQYIMEQHQDICKFRHDVKDHMLSLQYLINNNQITEALEYINNIVKSADANRLVTVNNGIADAIINHYISLAKAQSISINVKGRFPAHINIDSYDICTIMSNILRNAIEAVDELDNKVIWLVIGHDNNSLIIEESNACQKELIMNGNLLTTTKMDAVNHGMGLINISASVKKYNGAMNIKAENETFTITIVINEMGEII